MVCESENALMFPEKDPASAEFFGVDFTPRLTRWRVSGADYSLTTRFRVPGIYGFEYEVTTAGQTSDRLPVYPRTVGSTVTDGSMVATCRAVTTGSLESTVSSVAWTADAALTLTSQTESGQSSTVKIAGGVHGADYDVLVVATCNNQVIAQRCVLPVRKAPKLCYK